MLKFNGGKGAIICDRCRIIITDDCSNMSKKAFDINVKKKRFCITCIEKRFKK